MKKIVIGVVVMFVAALCMNIVAFAKTDVETKESAKQIATAIGGSILSQEEDPTSNPRIQLMHAEINLLREKVSKEEEAWKKISKHRNVGKDKKINPEWEEKRRQIEVLKRLIAAKIRYANSHFAWLDFLNETPEENINALKKQYTNNKIGDDAFVEAIMPSVKTILENEYLKASNRLRELKSEAKYNDIVDPSNIQTKVKSFEKHVAELKNRDPEKEARAILRDLVISKRSSVMEDSENRREISDRAATWISGK